MCFIWCIQREQLLCPAFARHTKEPWPLPHTPLLPKETLAAATAALSDLQVLLNVKWRARASELQN
jgi:hypothetical protein